jgi:hypothetical protein
VENCGCADLEEDVPHALLGHVERRRRLEDALVNAVRRSMLSVRNVTWCTPSTSAIALCLYTDRPDRRSGEQRLSTRRDGEIRPMRRYHYRGIGLLPVVWIVTGVVVAAIYDYFESLSTVGKILTAIAAVLLWPLLLFGFDIRIQRS